MKNMKKIISPIIGIIIIALFLLSSTTVGAGKRGVIVRLGNVQEHILNEGFHFKAPFIERVVKMDVTTQKYETNADAASKDLQSVDATIALNYSLSDGTVDTVYQTYYKQYETRLIDPAIQEAVKAGTAQFTAEELITKRSEVREAIKTDLASRLEPEGIVVKNFSIVNFNFSPEFDKAIEEKQVAEQNALKAQWDLERIKVEAEQQVTTAEAEAEAIRITAQALNENPNLVNLEAVKKWNGVLPTYTGGAMPFLNIK